MSFGLSTTDIVFVVRLAWSTVQNSRKACGKYDELTHEVAGLYSALQRLQREAERPESPINRPSDSCQEELKSILSGCRKPLLIIDKILRKYQALSDHERGLRKLWQRIQFGNGEVADLRDLRAQIVYQTSLLSMFLNTLSLGSVGRVEKQMNDAGGDLREIRAALNGITAQYMSGSRHEGSALTTYADDDKAVWRELRRELVKDGFTSAVISRNKDLIKAYVEELGNRGLLDNEESTWPTEDLQETHQAVKSADYKSLNGGGPIEKPGIDDTEPTNVSRRLATERSYSMEYCDRWHDDEPDSESDDDEFELPDFRDRRARVMLNTRAGHVRPLFPKVVTEAPASVYPPQIASGCHACGYHYHVAPTYAKNTPQGVVTTLGNIASRPEQCKIQQIFPSGGR